MSHGSRPTLDSESGLPDRLRSSGGTELERRLLNAASREQPSRELSERMARAIGIALPPVAPVEPPGAARPEALTPNAGGLTKILAAARPLLPWLSATAVVIAGAIVATRPKAPIATLPPTAAPAISSPSAALTASTVPAFASAIPQSRATEASPVTSSPPAQVRSVPASSVADIQDQIALMDRARAALSAGASGRALELLRQYQTQYPRGSFRPEASVLRIEALARLGRMSEARSLAERFAAESPNSPLSERVSRLLDAPRH
ncbi:MAG TPA: tetratricopeptide repeat protein [Polyangiaceae bacterium]|nr:tetratricopeptide repeat protein [Polyangiaceae bacterium]